MPPPKVWSGRSCFSPTCPWGPPGPPPSRPVASLGQTWPCLPWCPRSSGPVERSRAEPAAPAPGKPTGVPSCALPGLPQRRSPPPRGAPYHVEAVQQHRLALLVHLDDLPLLAGLAPAQDLHLRGEKKAAGRSGWGVGGACLPTPGRNSPCLRGRSASPPPGWPPPPASFSGALGPPGPARRPRAASASPPWPGAASASWCLQGARVGQGSSSRLRTRSPPGAQPVRRASQLLPGGAGVSDRRNAFWDLQSAGGRAAEVGKC